MHHSVDPAPPRRQAFGRRPPARGGSPDAPLRWTAPNLERESHKHAGCHCPLKSWPTWSPRLTTDGTCRRRRPASDRFLEMLAFAARAGGGRRVAGAAAELYALKAPDEGSHLPVGGCAPHFGAVDHYLGLLARSLGRCEDARRHFASAVALHERVGASAWAARSRAGAGAGQAAAAETEGGFRRNDGVWDLVYQGRQAQSAGREGPARPGRAALDARPVSVRRRAADRAENTQWRGRRPERPRQGRLPATAR